MVTLGFIAVLGDESGDAVGVMFAAAVAVRLVLISLVAADPSRYCLRILVQMVLGGSTSMSIPMPTSTSTPTSIYMDIIN